MSEENHGIFYNDTILDILALVSFTVLIIVLGIFLFIIVGASAIRVPWLWNILFPSFFVLPIIAFLISMVVFFMKNVIGSTRRNLSNLNLLVSTILLILDIVLWMISSSWSA